MKLPHQKSIILSESEEEESFDEDIFLQKVRHSLREIDLLQEDGDSEILRCSEIHSVFEVQNERDLTPEDLLRQKLLELI